LLQKADLVEHRNRIIAVQMLDDVLA